MQLGDAHPAVHHIPSVQKYFGTFPQTWNMSLGCKYLQVLYSSTCLLLRSSNQTRNRFMFTWVGKKQIKYSMAEYRTSWKWQFITFSFKLLKRIGRNIFLTPISDCWNDSSPSICKSSTKFRRIIRWAIGSRQFLEYESSFKGSSWWYVSTDYRILLLACK